MSGRDGFEVEAKRSIALPTAVLRRLARWPPSRLAGFAREGRLRHVVVLDRYIDTPSGRLEAALVRARLRSSAAGVTLTVKHAGAEAGRVTTRRELEAPATDALDPGAWPASAARTELEGLADGEGLVETVRLRQRRAVRLLRRGATVVEVSLDQLTALEGNRAIATRWELEAELKGGSVDSLDDLVAALETMPGVGDPLGSKRGFAMEAIREPHEGP